MYKDDGFASRKLSVMLEAGKRFQDKRPEIAEAAHKLSLGGPLAAASPAVRANYLERETTKLLKAIVQPPGFAGPPFLERRIGGALEWDQIAPTAQARSAGRPVARIVSLSDGRISDGYATGFLIASDLLVTNWHVFASSEDTQSSGAQFNYELDDAGNPQPTVVFEFDPTRFFYSNEDLDIAVVALADRPCVGTGALTAFGAVKLIPALGKILVGQAVNIIQHPDGRVKHYALQKNTVYVEPADADQFLLYTTDTLEGSSGSPAFNKDWELVAVHHGGVPRVEGGEIRTMKGEVWKKGMPETEIDWVANEGARVSKILAHLRATKINNPFQQSILARLLGSANDVLVPESVALVDLARPTSPTPAPQGIAPMNITVHGTANFYVNGAQPSLVPIAEAPTIPRAALAAAPEAKLRFDANYATRKGYDDSFLDGFSVPPPDAPADEIYKGPKGLKHLRYHHYSVAMHKDRRLALWTASNVDYDPKKRRKTREEFGNDQWKADPRIPIEQQIEDLEFYAPAKKFDRGHLVRRDDSAWGNSAREEEFANADTFHWTNCTPQHEEFNRDMFQYHGIWGGLEHHIANEAKFVENKLIVFAGPILADDDPEHDFGSGIEVKMPIAFWKVVVVAEDHGDNRRLRAYGFILDQGEAIDEHGLEARGFRPGKFKAQQVALSEITERSRVGFAQKLHDEDPFAGRAVESRRPLMALDQIDLG